jgi:sugar O-acyltransferase (sialic acid O-acetyltransferase NeuD family)
MNRRKLILVGGGDLCREVLWTAMCVPLEKRDWEPFGVLDDNPEKAAQHLASRGCALPVLGAALDHEPQEDEVFVPAIGNPIYKLRTCEAIAGKGGLFINLLHPTATIAPDVQLGNGVFCFVNSVVSVGAVLGDYVSLNVGAIVGHDARVATGCTLSPGSIICGNVQLDRGAFVGTDASLVPGNTMGELACLGAGSVAFTPIAPGLTAVGVPARAMTPPRPSSAQSNRSPLPGEVHVRE